MENWRRIWQVSCLAINLGWSDEGYHHHSHIPYQLAADFLKQCTFAGNESILDVGCGDGKITKEIAALTPHGNVLGLDYSESMIAFAKSNYPSGNLQFQLGDAAVMPNLEEFDIVFSFCALHWMPDQPTVLNNIYRSMKPGGRFLAVIPNAIYLDRATQATIENEFWKDDFVGYVHPTRNFALADYDMWLQSAQFSPHSVTMRETMMVFDGRTQLYKWLEQLLPHLKRLPASSHGLFVDQVIEALLHQLPHAVQLSGAIHIPLPVLEVNAQKDH
jgi:trans-aconitate 2-methyltransferase